MNNKEIYHLLSIMPKNRSGNIYYKNVAAVLTDYIKTHPTETIHLAERLEHEARLKEGIDRDFTFDYNYQMFKHSKLLHLNPTYKNKEAWYFNEYYKGMLPTGKVPLQKKDYIYQSFDYNQTINEENFLIEVARKIEEFRQKGVKSVFQFFKDFDMDKDDALSR